VFLVSGVFDGPQPVNLEVEVYENETRQVAVYVSDDCMQYYGTEAYGVQELFDVTKIGHSTNDRLPGGSQPLCLTKDDIFSKISKCELNHLSCNIFIKVYHVAACVKDFHLVAMIIF